MKKHDSQTPDELNKPLLLLQTFHALMCFLHACGVCVCVSVWFRLIVKWVTGEMEQGRGGGL